ncbi:MAG: flagellar hook protein FlgE [Asticcacaulis sp.]
MGLSAAMQAGVSGLAANANALSAISNNIANVNTTAYKRVRTDFQAIVTAASTPTGYNAGGVGSTTRHLISQLGTLQKASTDLDLGIDGQGFFVTTQSPTATAQDPHLFTRDGSFYPDTEGYLRNSSGLYLQGWPITASGGATLSAADLSQLVAINVENISAQIEQTTYAGITGNLSASQTVNTAEVEDVTNADGTTSQGYLNRDKTVQDARTMSNYDATSTASPNPGVKPDYEISIPVSDSQGGEKALTMSLIKTGANQWSYEVWSSSVDTADYPNKILKSGTLTFDSSGKLTQVDGVDGTGLSLDVQWSAASGVEDQTIGIDFASTAGALTQYNSSYTSRVEADGTPFSGVDEVKISETGMVTAVFKNGSTRDIAQLALATFVNADGLTPVSGNAYIVSNDSGPLTLKVPGASGAGLLSVGTLEASDVDLAKEFTDLITTQRAYSANSKTITTADEMLQELLNIKR